MWGFYFLKTIERLNLELSLGVKSTIQMHCFFGFFFPLAIIKFYPECTVEYVNDRVCWFFMCRRSEGVLSLSIGHSSWQCMSLHHQSFQGGGEGREGMERSCGAPVEKLISFPPIKTCFILLSFKVVPNVSTTSRPHETGIWNSSFPSDFGFPSSASVLWPDYGADGYSLCPCCALCMKTWSHVPLTIGMEASCGLPCLMSWFLM